MKLTDYEILDALDNGKKIRRSYWWENGIDDYLKRDRDENLINALGLIYIADVNDLWARDWEVC